MREVQISGDVWAGERRPLLLLAGPCVVETPEFTLRMAETIQRIADRHGVGFVFKASFDKANRSAGDSPRGPGL